LEDQIYDSRIDQKALKEAKARSAVATDPNYNISSAVNAAALSNQTSKSSEIKSGVSSNENVRGIETFREARSARLFSNQNPLKINERNYVPSIIESIGNLYEEINWDYALIERLDRKNLTVNLIPFNLGKVLNNINDVENYELEAGDIVTVFSATDLRVPISKRRVLVRIDGEVYRPGIYQVMPTESLSDVLQRAGGLTHDAYLFGAAFYRDEVRKSQVENLEKLLRKLEAETSGQLAQASQSLGAGSDASLNQARIFSAQQAQKQALERIRNLRPEGRIALGLDPQYLNFINKLPKIRMQNGDRLYIPPRPDFVYLYGAVNTESALIFKEGNTLQDYLELGGVSSGADRDSVILIRADGSAQTRSPEWFSSIKNTKIMPGDSIVMPEKLDREASWSSFVRNAKDITQIFYQLGLGAAGLKALGY
jgi:protein involved in polysaccharide export with SLBB domain